MNETNSSALFCPTAELTGGDVGLAFGLVIAAAAATMLGAAVPFLLAANCCAHRLRKRKSLDLILAAGLSFAGGVMLYISFAEIFIIKSVEAFAECMDDAFANLYATLSFFGGMLCAWLLIRLVHWMQHSLGKRRARRQEAEIATDTTAMDGEVRAWMHKSASQTELMEQGEEGERKEENSMEISVFSDGEDELDAIAAVMESSDRKRLAAMSLGVGFCIAIHNLPGNVDYLYFA